MSTQIKKSAIDGLLGTYDILVGAIEPAGVTVPTISNPKRRGIISCCPKGIHISVGSTPVWKMIGVSGGSTDSTFTVRFQAQAAPLGTHQILAEGATTTWQVDSICICHSESGLFDPVSADSDGFFEITMDKDAYAAVADREYWRFEWDNGYESEMSTYYGYIKPQIDISVPTFYPDNDEYNYVVIDSALPARRDFIISFYDSIYTQDITSSIALSLTGIYWNTEGVPHAMMEPGSQETGYSGESIQWDEGMCPCIEVALPEFLQDSGGHYVAVKCYIKLPLNNDPSDPYEISLDLPGYHGSPVDGEGIDVDTMRNNGWIVEYV